MLSISRFFAALAIVFASVAFGPSAFAAGPLKFVVYGGSGRIGSHFVNEALSRGHSVTSVDIKPVDPNAPKRERLTERQGDILALAKDASPIANADIVIVAINTTDPTLYLKAAQSLVAAMRGLGARAPRLMWSGGGSTLLTAAGTPVPERPAPPGSAPAAGQIGHQQVLDYLRTVKDVKWTVLSPSLMLDTDGPRTGKYRVSGDVAVMDAAGNSRISMSDLAVAMIDEAENAKQVGKRFTAGY